MVIACVMKSKTKKRQIELAPYICCHMLCTIDICKSIPEEERNDLVFFTELWK